MGELMMFPKPLVGGVGGRPEPYPLGILYPDPTFSTPRGLASWIFSASLHLCLPQYICRLLLIYIHHMA